MERGALRYGKRQRDCAYTAIYWIFCRYTDMFYRYKQHVCKQVSVGLLVRPHTVSKLERLVVIYRHPTTNNNVALCGQKSAYCHFVEKAFSKQDAILQWT